MKNALRLYPAYGRRYPKIQAMMDDWMKGKDFSVNPVGGPYTSIRDFVGDTALPQVAHYDGVALTQATPDATMLRTISLDTMKDYK